jgi:hypothetical protein
VADEINMIILAAGRGQPGDHLRERPRAGEGCVGGHCGGVGGVAVCDA